MHSDPTFEDFDRVIRHLGEVFKGWLASQMGEGSDAASGLARRQFASGATSTQSYDPRLDGGAGLPALLRVQRGRPADGAVGGRRQSGRDDAKQSSRPYE